ncbi:MAG: EAL domain-containing protein [Duganella sp.]
MPIRIKSLHALLSFLFAIGMGVAVSLLLSQLVWSESSKSRINSYTSILLEQAESVAADLTSALKHLDSLPRDDCSASDLIALKRATFEYRSMKDAGRLQEGKIGCSALWGKLEQPHDPGAPSMVTRNGVALWINVPSYAMPDMRVDLSAIGHSYVVTSPTVFAAFENHAPEISAQVSSSDGTRIMRRFGAVMEQRDRLLRRHIRHCSLHYDICAVGQIDSNIFAVSRTPLLMLISVVGALFGATFWVAINHFARKRKTMSARLAAAIKADAITLQYQPIVQAATGRLVGFEALARWHDKHLGHVRPDVFIAKAAKINLSDALNRRIISRALRECAARLRQDSSIYLSINLDISAFLDRSLIDFLLEQAQQHSVPLQQIAIEILESATTDLGKMRTGITDLRKLGLQVFIDDFGTGYSSLAYLGRLDVDKIKIDRIFTQSAGTDSAAAIILATIYQLTQDIQTGVVFEGVETEEQMRAILAICPQALAQGWYYSKAVAIEEILPVYRQAQQGF